MKKFFKSHFIKAISTLISGAIIAQIISLLISPLITRLYTTEELGVYTLVLTGVTMFGGVICGRYDMAIVSEQSDENVFKLVKISFIFTLVTSAIIGIGYYFFYDLEMLPSYLIALVMFLLLFLTGIRNIFVSFNNRNKEYKLMTQVYIVRTVVKDFLIVLLGTIKLGALGLIISQILGEIVGLKKQGQKILPYSKEIMKIPNRDLKGVLKSHYKQPVYSVPSIFANNFSYASINIFIAKLFGLSVLGLYFLTYKMLGMPLTIISSNVSKVFFQEASREYAEKKNYKKTFIKTTIILTAIAVPMTIVLYFFAPLAFTVIFGKEWREAGLYVQILAPMFAIRFIVSALSPGMIISKKQNIDLLINCSFIILSVVSFFIAKENEYTVINYLKLITYTFSFVYIVAFVIFAKNAFNKTKRQS